MIEQLANRLRKRQKHLRKWAKRQDISCYRLYERDIADQPVIVDWYDGEAVVWCQRRTRNETPQQEAAWEADVETSVLAGLDCRPEQVIMKSRKGQRQEGSEQYERTAVVDDQAVRVVREHGVQAEINLHSYLDTGMFLDHRPLRYHVQQQAAGKRVLNLFCYTGLFTAHAAVGGAKRTVSVDLSNTYLQWAERNLAHNGIETSGHKFIRHDVMNYLKQIQEGDQRFDIIVCDPPTFSNSKKTKNDFQVEKAQHDLIHGCMGVLADSGVVYFSNNFRGFQLDASAVSTFAVKEISGLDRSRGF